MSKNYTFITKEEIYKILLDLKEGDTFIDDHGYKCHVVTNLPKEQGGRIVFKYYGKRKQWWHYFIESYFYFEFRMRTEEDFKSLKLKIKKK
jgi:hypothetical protein